jgi:hypothetical protein
LWGWRKSGGTAYWERGKFYDALQGLEAARQNIQDDTCAGDLLWDEQVD